MRRTRHSTEELPPEYDDRYLSSGDFGHVTPLPPRKQHRSVSEPPVKKPQSTRNRRNGKDAQRDIARLTGARDIGITGTVDLDGHEWWGEVKNTHGLPAWFAKGIAQLAAKHDRPGFLFVCVVKQGVPTRRFVVQTFEQWAEIQAELEQLRGLKRDGL